MGDYRVFRKSEATRAIAAERLAWGSFLVSASVFLLLLFPFFFGARGVPLVAAVVFFGALSFCLLLRALLVSCLSTEATREAKRLDGGEKAGKVNDGHRRTRSDR